MSGQNHWLAAILVSCAFVLQAGAQSPQPIVYYSFDALSDPVIDESGNGNDGTLAGGVTLVDAGYYGGCFQFNGVDSYVELTRPIQDDFSIAAWIKTSDEAPGTTHAYEGNGLFWSDVGGPANDMAVGIIGTKLSFFAGNPNASVNSNADVVIDEWIHVGTVRDTSTGEMTIYINGEFDNSIVHGNTGPLDANPILAIGSNVLDNRYYNGLIDDVQIYDVPVPASEMPAIMGGLKRKMASRPMPADGATDVAPDIVLSWKTSREAVERDVYFGTSFEDVNTATRANPLGVLVSEGQVANTYDPEGVLDFGQTYYWRIDEVNGAPDHTIFKGEVWTFMAEPVAYPIEDIIVTTNMIPSPGPVLENIINGSGLNPDDQHSTNPDLMWAGMPNGTDPAYIEFEFPGLYRLHEALIWNYNMAFELVLGLGCKEVTVEHSQDGVDWTVLGDMVFAQGTASSDYEANTTLAFEGAAVKYVRFTMHSSFGGKDTYGLSEVRFLYIPAYAREPEPVDGAANVALDTILSWRSGRGATSHEVYLSTDPNAPALAATTTEASYAASLDLESTYYWNVDEDDGTAVWAGDAWSFSTQEYIEVDGFETYTDDIEAGETVWQTWIDGLDDTSNGGGMVGHDPSPFAELRIVRTGAQSMPFYFDNASASDISETDRTFAAPQDWTIGGVQSLSLWFYGDSHNTGRLYVKINDTKVVYDGDAEAIRVSQWQPWNIDLSTAGDLSNVRLLTIGVEGAGTGLVLIDDIRLYARTSVAITPAEPDDTNLVAYYALNGNANDGSGNGYDGVEIGGFLYVTGVNGQALDLDGAGGFVDITNATDWPSGKSPRTISAWAMTRTVADGWRWIIAYGSPGGGEAMFLGLNGANLYGGSYWDDIEVENFWVVDEWYHTCQTYDGTTARVYGNGVALASDARDWNLVLSRAHIGQQVNDLSEFWNGAVDDVCVYGAALTPEEVAYLAGKRALVHVPF